MHFCLFTDGRIADMPFIEIPLQTLIKFTPSAQGCDVSYISFDVITTLPLLLPYHNSQKKLFRVSSPNGVDLSLKQRHTSYGLSQCPHNNSYSFNSRQTVFC
ncbi:XPO7 [Lepeophtheirus salmonis]|uniref:XPO7 n=1 Tax=Lepeophtheirus salmonis TaxID=72036 RepID=A0A7R8H6V9_LEPSM|nr:XPO7 [Lepeophtheirus salmonis]CAF2896519.1 XPO7 [Lepeophtheirus salmonis]